MTPKENADKLYSDVQDNINMWVQSYGEYRDHETHQERKKICLMIINGKIDLIYSLPIDKEYGTVEDYVNYYKEVLKEIEKL